MIQEESCAPPERDSWKLIIPVASPLANLLCASSAPALYHYFFKRNQAVRRKPFAFLPTIRTLQNYKTIVKSKGWLQKPPQP
jgi:hypothetical protein